MNPVVSFDGFSWTYQGEETPALDSINLEIGDGEVVGIVGNNEQGKTTLARTLNGLIPYSHQGVTDGEARIFGEELQSWDRADLSRKVGLVFSNPDAQFTSMSVEEELLFGLENLGLSPGEIESRLSWAREKLQLDEFFERPPYDLSGGQKQRVAIGSVLIMRPDILVLDEPTSMLDPLAREQIFSLLEELKEEEDFTLIVVEHNLENLFKLVDRVIRLENNSVAEDCSLSEFLTSSSGARGDLYLPEVTSLFQELEKDRTPPVTVEEATDRFNQEYDEQFNRENISEIDKTGVSVPSSSFIETSRLSFTYPGGTQALNDINVNIREGEFIALIGQNGSGKTTFSKNICGLLNPTEGTVEVNGKPTENYRREDLAPEVGYVFQNPDHQLFNPSVEKEILTGPQNLGLSQEQCRERLKEAAETAGVDEELFPKHPFFLPRGLRQRVAIASVLAMRPKAIIVDEPTTGQDYRQSLAVMEFLARLNEEKDHTIIIITHDIYLVARFARRIILFGNGKKLADGPTREVFSQENKLREAHVKPPQITRFGQEVLGESLLTVSEAFEYLIQY